MLPTSSFSALILASSFSVFLLVMGSFDAGVIQRRDVAVIMGLAFCDDGSEIAPSIFLPELNKGDDGAMSGSEK